MRLDYLRRALKKYDILFSTYRKLADKTYRINYIDYLRNKPLKSRETIRKEISMIRSYWNCDPMIYYKYRLYEKNLTGEELLDYIPPYFFYNVYIPSLYNEGDAMKIADSKIRQNDFFVSHDIPAPAKIATVISGQLSGRHGESSDFGNLLKDIRESAADLFFMKPDNGRGGKGIFRIEKRSGDILINGRTLEEKLFKTLVRNKDMIIQEGIVQRRDLMDIYPYSVNTLRTVTQNFNGNVKIIAVVLRMGRGGSYVDNISSGGIFAYIDIETGMLSPVARDLYDNEGYTAHPDTGFVFKGYKIPGWEEIKQSITGVAASAPELPDVAWDITLTDEGIKIIEINLYYGIDTLQRSFGGMRRKLNITPSVMHASRKVST